MICQYRVLSICESLLFSFQQNYILDDLEVVIAKIVGFFQKIWKLQFN